jgi:hypothetical protein
MSGLWVFVTEDCVTSTSKRKRLGSLDRDDLFPDFSLNVEDKNIIERNSSVVETTMSSIDVYFTFVIAGSCVSSWRRSSDERLFVLFSLLVASDTGPNAFLSVEPPGIVQANSRTGVTSKHEHAVTSWDRNCYMLGSRKRDFFTLRFKFLPNPVLTLHSELIHVGYRLHLLALSSLSDSSVHEVAALAYEVHRVTRAGAGLFPGLFLFLPLQVSWHIIPKLAANSFILKIIIYLNLNQATRTIMNFF